MIERELDEIWLDSKWSKTCESFLNFVDNKLKDHQGLAPDPAQYLESWYINRLNHTIELHVTLYQYVVNHQMQEDSITKHLGTASVTSLSYESYIEAICTFCQTIDHTNHKAIQEKSRRKALQAEFNGGCNGNQGGQTGDRGRNSGSQPYQTGCGRGKYHNWIPKDQFDNLDKEGYQHLIRDRISCGEIQANTSDTNPAPSTVPTTANPTASPTQIQVSGATVTPETPSILTGAPPSVVPPTSQSVSMALVTPSWSSHGSTTATQMESGPNTLLCQLMSNASAQFAAPTTSSHANDTVTTTFNGGNYQIRRMHYAYCYTQHALHHEYQGALVDSGTNGGMARSDIHILATVPHAFVDITGVGGEVLHRLPIVQGASLVHTIDEGPIILIMSQYAHNQIQNRSTPSLRLSILGELSTTHPSLPVGNNWCSLMKATLFPSMSEMVCITWTWSCLWMTIWSDTHMSSSLPMALGTLTPLMRNSSSMLLMPSLPFPGSNNDAMHVKRLICSLSLPHLSLHHLTH